MKAAILLSLILAFSISSQAEEYCPTGQEILGDEHVSMLEELSGGIKKEFKRRPVTIGGYTLALAIEANFTVPFIGNDPYFGRIYFKKGDNEKIKYRDELIADDHYDDEKKKESTFFFSSYKVSDINSSRGLSLIKAAGAEVTLKSSDGKFSPDKGGRLNLKVKAPGESSFQLVLDTKMQNGRVMNHVWTGSKWIPFDSMKINAEDGLFGGPSILSGIENIQFTQNGQLTHTINK